MSTASPPQPEGWQGGYRKLQAGTQAKTRAHGGQAQAEGQQYYEKHRPRGGKGVWGKGGGRDATARPPAPNATDVKGRCYRQGRCLE